MAENTHDLIGRNGVLTFPEATAYVRYESETSLHWRTVDGDDVEAEGDETLSYERLSDSLHFLNWIEADGFTVSQIIDTASGKVKVFWSFHDEDSERGQRGALFLDGTFEFDAT